MELTRRTFLAGLSATACLPSQPVGGSDFMKYVRYEHGGRSSYGVLDGETIREIEGGLFADKAETGKKLQLSSVKLLWPCEPSKILAVGLNYKSHIGDRPAPQRPELFYKPVSALLAPGGEIVMPPDAADVHYEGELVLVIGKKARRVSVAEAKGCIFGYTCGCDVSERDWQKNDLQWWRAKGSDTFAPLGPAIAVDIEYDKARLQTRVNGAVKQSQFVNDLLFDPPTVVSFASRYVTLLPGDVIFTGTPGSTSALIPGDKVEVEIDGIGILHCGVAG